MDEAQLMAEIALDPKKFKAKLAELKEKVADANMRVKAANAEAKKVRDTANAHAEEVLASAKAQGSDMKKAAFADIADRTKKLRAYEQKVNAQVTDADKLLAEAAKADRNATRKLHEAEARQEKVIAERERLAAKVKAVNEAWGS